MAVAAAVPWVGHADGPRPDDAVPTPIEQLAERPPASLGGGAVEACAGEPVASEAWWRSAEAARGELLYMNEAAALGLADDAIAATACLDEPAAPERLARLVFWRGLANHYLGRPEAARADFVWARTVDPDLTWNADLGDDGRDTFDAAPPTARARLSWVAPGYSEATLDGHPVEQGVEVVPGSHLLQLRAHGGTWLGMRVELVAPQTRVGVPASLGSRAAFMADDPDSRAVLSDLLAAALGPGEPVYVAGTRVWRGTTGRTDWVVLPGSRTVKRGRPPVIIAGGAVVVGGAIAAGVAYGSAAQADADRCDAETIDQWEAADGRWKRARSLYGVGWSAVAIGVGLGTTGALLPRHEVGAQAWISPGGGGVRLTVTR